MIPPCLFCPIIPILTPFCQTTIFAHLRQRAAGFCDTGQCSLWVRQTETCYRETQKHQPASVYTRTGKTLESHWHADTDTQTKVWMQLKDFSPRSIFELLCLFFFSIQHLLHLLFSLLLSHFIIVSQEHHNVWSLVMLCSFCRAHFLFFFPS